MFVILWIKENKYYAYTKENHWTDNIQAAGKFNTLEAAQKYAKNGLKDKLQELQYLRPAPSGYIWVKSVKAAKTAIWQYEHNMIDDNILIDLDHDAGDYASEGGDYIKLLDWLEAKNIVDTGYSFHLHSMNPVGVQNMRAIIKTNGWREI